MATCAGGVFFEIPSRETVPRAFSVEIPSRETVARAQAAALARVGQAYHAGRYGVGENAAAAAFFYAAAGDYAPALVNLGHAYRKGHGVPRDAARSARLFAKAAALSNHPSALR